MKNIDEKYVIQQYAGGSSTIELAKELGTYPKKIERILKKNNQPIRSRSESQKLAIQQGRSKHPTEGTTRSEAEKLAISKGVEKAWEEMDAEDKKIFSQNAKERWDNIPPEKKREMQAKAGRALRTACLEGSKQEKFVKKQLEARGYEVVMHKKDLIEGNFEIDLFLPALNTIIEIDGPQHFLPYFGEDKLAKTIKMDSKKNGMLLGAGFCIVRVKYLCKNMSKAVERKLWKVVWDEIQGIEKKFPPKGKRFIEIEVS